LHRIEGLTSDTIQPIPYYIFTLASVEPNDSIEKETDFFREQSNGHPHDANVYESKSKQSVEDLQLDPSLADAPGQVGMETMDNRDRVQEPPGQKYA
jgi:hypothetical protein